MLVVHFPYLRLLQWNLAEPPLVENNSLLSPDDVKVATHCATREKQMVLPSARWSVSWCIADF